MADFPKDRIAAIEKQIDRLRKEVDDRISSNHTLWRAGLAGIGALILLKESLDLSRLILLLPILCMSLAAHWLNQTLTLYRSGDAMASCELKINSIASELLKEHETILTRARCKMLTKRLAQILFTAIAATLLYWYTMWQVQPLESATQALLLWRIGLVSAAIANLVAAINLYRFLTFPWPSLHTVIVTQASGTNAA